MDNKEVRKEIITLIIACTTFCIGDAFFKLFTWDSYGIARFASKLMILMSIIIFSLFVAVFKKTWKATLGTYIIVFLITIINQIKVCYTDEPLYFSDINFLSNIDDLIKLVSGNNSIIWTDSFELYLIIFVVTICIIVFISYKNNIIFENKKIRKSIVLIDVILLICLFVPVKYTKELYLKMFFNPNEYKDYESYTTNLSYYYTHGLFNGMYGMYLNKVFVEPQGYDETVLNKKLEDVKIDTEKYGKPNIIVVFSESFWEIDKLDEIKFDKKITSNFNNLKQKGELINIITPSYGGMSENVTFEMLTGANMNYFSKGYIPIMSLYSRDGSEKIPSLVKNLKNNGYDSEIIFGKDYYNSKDAYKKVGFDKYTELLDDKEIYLSDKVCTDTIIDRLENKNEKPVFCVMATIEGHMPYSKNKYSSYDISITESNLKESMNDTVLSYSQGIYNSDCELKRLYDYIENFDEPTLLIFLGDHLPYLYTEESENVIDNLEYFNTYNELLNNYRLYNPQALILSNYEENIKIPKYIGVDLLLNTIVNQLDVEIENYYKWLYNTKEYLPGINRYIAFDKNGNLYKPEDISDDMKRIYEEKKLMQYKFFINN